MLPHVFRVTKFDPADRDEDGRFIGAEDVFSDHGPVEQATIDAVRAFAEDSACTELTIREPGVSGFVHFGVEPPIDGYGLADLFPRGLADFHDGAQVTLAVGLELVRVMLRDHGAWCRLEVHDRFFVHVGYDQYIYVGSACPCLRAVAYTHQRGLFAEEDHRSPYDQEGAEDEPGCARPADAAFWAELAALVEERGSVLLEEGYVLNASRWHRVTLEGAATVKAQLAPRSRLWIWPDLVPVTEAQGSLAEGELQELVWEDQEGRILSRNVDAGDPDGIAALLASARGAMVLSHVIDQRHPLLTAVLTDADGVLRARWVP